MLTLDQLYKLLDLNESLLIDELDGPNRRKSDLKRLLELQLHRFEVMKCIIELQNKALSLNETKKVA